MGFPKRFVVSAFLARSVGALNVGMAARQGVTTRSPSVFCFPAAPRDGRIRETISAVLGEQASGAAMADVLVKAHAQDV